MNRALYAAASGMDIEQRNLDVISANLAGADVAGFAGQVARARPVLDAEGRVLGARADGTALRFRQGKLEKSGGPCDLALRGEGFLVVQRGSEVGYLRCGAFSRDARGELAAEGWRLPGVRVPADAARLRVDARGRVYGGAGDAPLGRVHVVRFDRPEALTSVDGTVYRAGRAAGAPRPAATGEGGTEVVFGSLERSSVSIVESMMEILDAQRAYEADAKGVQAADEMIRIANNLQRG